MIVSRPSAEPAKPDRELGVRDFCWTEDGEILAPNPLPCACPDCGCFAAFVGVESARPTTWGVVERRSAQHVTTAIREGSYLRGWQEVESFDGMIMSDILEVDKRLVRIPLGTVVGVWLDTQGEFSVYDRTPGPA